MGYVKKGMTLTGTGEIHQQEFIEDDAIRGV